MTERERYAAGRLTVAKSGSTGREDAAKGLIKLGLDKQKDGSIYVPRAYDMYKPAALAVMLHGAGAPVEQGLAILKPYAESFNMIVVAPAARKYSWDIIASSSFGPDVIYLDQALAHVFEHYAIDPAHVAIGGFSDGASYALSIGLTNGDLFTHILAFSPGFAYTLQTTGKPAIFVSHGIHDPVLAIDPCSRRFVPLLKQQGYNVNYIELNGEHSVPDAIAKRAVDWFLK